MRIAVFGALGHTGRFVVGEARRRGHDVIAIVRDALTLAAAHEPDVEARVATLDDAASLTRALAGADVVIHCAGPFLDTAAPLIDAALAARTHYLDITAEQASAQATLERSAAARAAGVVLLPAAGFYGGLGDLLATVAFGAALRAERIEVAVALDHWWPTAGTRKTGARNTVPRLVVREGRLADLDRDATPPTWPFPAPFGVQPVAQVPFTETILIAAHLAVDEVRSYINEGALDDVGDPTTPAPVATDERGRSTQTFVMDVVVRADGEQRRARARGRDIYAVTAPIVVEAAERVYTDPAPGGSFALGARVDAADVVRTLTAAGDLSVEFV